MLEDILPIQNLNLKQKYLLLSHNLKFIVVANPISSAENNLAQISQKKNPNAAITPEGLS
jgi:hypothetical protein